jgi:hypothetical protein
MLKKIKKLFTKPVEVRGGKDNKLIMEFHKK